MAIIDSQGDALRELAQKVKDTGKQFNIKRVRMVDAPEPPDNIGGWKVWQITVDGEVFHSEPFRPVITGS